MDNGDAAWVMVSAALVLFMTPGLALFYGGMDRTRNVLNMLMMNFWCLLIIPILWALGGFSLAQVPFDNDFIGTFDEAFLRGSTSVTAAALARHDGVPRHVRRHHPGADLGRGRRPHEVRRLGDLRPGVAAPGLRPRVQVGLRRLARAARLARLRRRHRDPRQRRHRGAGGGARARQAQGLAGRGPPAPLHAARHAGHRHPVVRLVRLQRRLGPGRQRHGHPGVHQHLPRRRRGRPGVGGRRADPGRPLHQPRRRLRHRRRAGGHHPRRRLRRRACRRSTSA